MVLFTKDSVLSAQHRPSRIPSLGAPLSLLQALSGFCFDPTDTPPHTYVSLLVLVTFFKLASRVTCHALECISIDYCATKTFTGALL